MDPSGPLQTLRTASVDDLAAIGAIEVEQFAHLAYPYFVLRQLFELHGPDWTVAEYGGVGCLLLLPIVVVLSHRRRVERTRRSADRMAQMRLWSVYGVRGPNFGLRANPARPSSRTAR